jgi:hypothetical protein
VTQPKKKNKPRILIRPWLDGHGIVNPSGRDIIRYRSRESSAKQDENGVWTVHADAPDPRRGKK